MLFVSPFAIRPGDPIPDLNMGSNSKFDFGFKTGGRNINSALDVFGGTATAEIGPWDVGGKFSMPVWRTSGIGQHLNEQNPGGRFRFGEGKYTFGVRRSINDRIKLGTGIKYDADEDKLTPKLYATYKFQKGGPIPRSDYPEEPPPKFERIANSVVPVSKDKPWVKAEPKTAKAYRRLVDFAKQNDSDVRAYSGFRSYQRSKKMYEHFWETYDEERGKGKNLEGTWIPAVAKPGESHHNYGTAIDFNIPAGNWRNHPRYEFMKKYGEMFGFEQTHSGEGWHWVYNPEKDQSKHFSPAAFESIAEGKQRSGPPKLFEKSSQNTKQNQTMETRPSKFQVPQLQKGGYVGKQDPIDRLPKMPVQAEKGEKVIFPDLSIVPVKANKSHSQMDDDEITDILPVWSYVASADNSQKISRDQADQVVVGLGPPKYKDGQYRKKLEVNTLGDMFGRKKKYTPAKLTNRIKNKFPISSRKDDPFCYRAKEENRAGRAPYLMGMIGISEGGDRIEAPKSMQQSASKPRQTSQSPSSSPQNRQFGGFVYDSNKNRLRGPNIHAGFGDWIGSALQGVAGIWGTISQNKQKKRMRRDFNQIIDHDLPQAYDQQRDYLGQGTMAGAAGIVAQDPTYEAPQLDMSYARSMADEVPRYVYDYQASQVGRQQQGLRDNLFANTSRFGQAASYATAANNQGVQSMSNLAANLGRTNVQLRNRKLGRLGRLSNQQAQFDAQAANQTRANQNQQFAQLGGLGTNYYNQLAGLEAAELQMESMLTAAKHGQEAALNNSMINSAIYGAQGVGRAASAINNNQQTNATGIQNQYNNFLQSPTNQQGFNYQPPPMNVGNYMMNNNPYNSTGNWQNTNPWQGDGYFRLMNQGG